MRPNKSIVLCLIDSNRSHIRLSSGILRVLIGLEHSIQSVVEPVGNQLREGDLQPLFDHDWTQVGVV